MFVDTAIITAKAGSGGDGAVSFHRDKFTVSGGPDGGNGGNGGNIVFQADKNLSTLSDFRYKKKYLAEDGKNGASARRTGKSGEDMIVHVPLGTILKNDEDGRIIADLSDFNRVVIAKGGKGGAGNINFSNSVRQAPKFAKPGTPGEELTIRLELKLLADVAIVGYPNVGKSTFLSTVSNARPQVANYHFTTLSPVLGVVEYRDNTSFVIADIPGLIEGAWKGKGLGHQFLKHIERCRIILHMVDISGSEGRNPIEDFRIINNELYSYDSNLSSRPVIVVGSKCDAASNAQIKDFKAYIESEGYKFFPISSMSRDGIDDLIASISQMLTNLPSMRIFEPDESYTGNKKDIVSEEIEIKYDKGIYFVNSPKIDRLIKSVNFEDYDSMQYFQNMLIKYGVISSLKKFGAKEGDTISMCGTEFDFFD